MKVISIFFQITSIILFSKFINCLYEDQIETYDWRHQYVGKPLYSHIDTSMGRLFIASDHNVLAALNSKTGKIIWRKIFETNLNGKIDTVLWGIKEIVVVTGNGKRVQGFGYKHGFATWEYNLFNADQANKEIKIIGVESKQDKDSYYFTNGLQLCYVSIRDKACVDLPLDGGFVYNNLYENEQGVFIIGTKDNLVQKLHYNTLLSSQLSKTISTEKENLSFQNCLNSVDSNDFACHSKQIKNLYLSQIKAGNNKMDFEEFKLDDLKGLESNSDLALVWLSKETYLLKSRETNNEKMNLYLFKKTNLLKKIENVNSFKFLAKDQNQFLVFAKYLETNKLNFNTIDLKSGQEKSDLSVNVNIYDKEQKDILMINANIIESRNSQLSLNVLCFFADYSMSVFDSQGTKLFVREEALAYIVSVEMVDFPLLHLQEEFEDEFGKTQNDNILTMFYKRIRAQLIHLREFILVDLYQKAFNYLNNNNLKRAGSSEGSISKNGDISSGISGDLSAEEITREEFNLNKLIVAVTSIGKVFGIYSSANGKILWSFHLKNTIPFKVMNNNNKLNNSMPLFLQRTTAHYPYEPQCAVVSKVKLDNDLIKTRIFYFNPINGKPSKDQSSPNGLIVDYQVKQVFMLNQVDEHFLKPLVIFDQENILHVLPESSTANLITKSTKTATIYSAITSSVNNNKHSSLIGYAMKYTNKPLPELWRINLEDETIVAIGSKLPNDHIHSHGKVLGDRSVLYKYLNPNLIAVVTTGIDANKVAFVNVYLIDTVTGSVINSFNHKRCKGPVNIVHSENWFFYSYYNIKYRRNEVTSVELFEGSNQFNSTHFSSLNDVKPITYTKSYIVQKSFDSMQITQTEKGITTKDIIVACQFGVLIEIPWILIDPRRPIKMTELDREENLLPYMPEIPLNYEFSLNYYNYVYNIRGITTSPSGLESTSLVFVYGLDIFYTRVFPSKTFDMIREDFDYFFITTLIVGLILGTIVSKKLASQSNLKKAWK